MPSSRGFLDRFRASGTPGAAAGAGVPADRVTERDVELAALLEQLSATEQAAREIRADAHSLARSRRAAGTDDGRRLVAAARREAESDRRDAAARVSELSEQETAHTLAAASAEAGAIREHASRSLPGYADRVVGLVLDRLDIDLGGDTERRGPVPP